MIDQFIECETCKAKPGSPTLCADCLTRRNEWLKERGYAAPFGRRLAVSVMRHIAATEDAQEYKKTMILVGNEPVGFRDLYWCHHQNENNHIPFGPDHEFLAPPTMKDMARDGSGE